MKIKWDKYEEDWEMYVRLARLRVTPARITLLKVLEKNSKPIALDALKRALGTSVDRITLYRSLESLEKVGLIQHSVLGYEVTKGRAHHHHAICTECGLVEDIEVSHRTHPEAEALKSTSKFSFLNRHAVDFFGKCKACV